MRKMIAVLAALVAVAAGVFLPSPAQAAEVLKSPAYRAALYAQKCVTLDAPFQSDPSACMTVGFTRDAGANGFKVWSAEFAASGAVESPIAFYVYTIRIQNQNGVLIWANQEFPAYWYSAWNFPPFHPGGATQLIYSVSFKMYIDGAPDKNGSIVGTINH